MHGYMEVGHSFTFPMNSCTIVATLTGGQWRGGADFAQCYYDEPHHCLAFSAADWPAVG